MFSSCTSISQGRMRLTIPPSEGLTDRGVACESHFTAGIFSGSKIPAVKWDMRKITKPRNSNLWGHLANANT